MTSVPGTVLRAPFTRRAWADLLYTAVGLLVGVVAFYLTVAALGAGLLLAITVIGLPLVAVVLIAARRLGVRQRRLAGALLGERIAEPAPLAVRPGPLGWLGSHLSDTTAWRAVAYLLLRPSVMSLTAAAALVFWVQGAVASVYPALWAAGLNRPAPTVGPVHFDHWPAVLLMTPIGLVLFFAAPWVLHLLLVLDRWLMRWLLSPGSADQRVRTLEVSRARVVDDSAATLRRIERDLHDGAQARLVALGMDLTLLRESIGRTEPDRLRELADAARATATAAITELRDLVRGIHPPALDQGLEPALSTLAATSPVPVELAVDLPERPSPAIESIAYFCVAELLTNVGRHSGARTAGVSLTGADGTIRVRVTDDGRGGARIGAGTGLTGLAERIGSVDGRLLVASPAGGPTVVTVELPTRA